MWFHIQSFYRPIQNLSSSETRHLCSLTTQKIPPNPGTGTPGTDCHHSEILYGPRIKCRCPKTHTLATSAKAAMGEQPRLLPWSKELLVFLRSILKWLLQNPFNVLSFFAPLSLFSKANQLL